MTYATHMYLVNDVAVLLHGSDYWEWGYMNILLRYIKLPDDKLHFLSILLYRVPYRLQAYSEFNNRSYSPVV